MLLYLFIKATTNNVKPVPIILPTYTSAKKCTAKYMRVYATNKAKANNITPQCLYLGVSNKAKKVNMQNAPVVWPEGKLFSISCGQSAEVCIHDAPEKNFNGRGAFT